MNLPQKIPSKISCKYKLPNHGIVLCSSEHQRRKQGSRQDYHDIIILYQCQNSIAGNNRIRLNGSKQRQFKKITVSCATYLISTSVIQAIDIHRKKTSTHHLLIENKYESFSVQKIQQWVANNQSPPMIFHHSICPPLCDQRSLWQHQA